MDYKNIFVEPLANVPREDLKDNGVTRKRNLCESEVAIVPSAEFKYLSEVYVSIKTCILFNSNTNKYIVISDFYTGW